MIPGWLDAADAFVSGLRRIPSEHYTVFAGPTAGPLVRIDAPLGSYFADPFPWVHEGVPWLLVEQFFYARNRARLAARRLEGGPVVPIPLAGAGHASFPCIFEDEGERFLIPETGGDGVLDLYGCERFPDSWRLLRRLAKDIDAADTVPLFHAGRWFLLTSLRDSRTDGGHRRLAIFHTEDLRSGALVAHPVNEERRFLDSPVSFGRNGGPIHFAEGRRFRPVQASVRHYGEALRWSRIEALSTERFEETILDAPPPGLGPLAERPLHHVAGCPGFLACDTRDRFPRG